jgi:hypothetical protein
MEGHPIADHIAHNISIRCGQRAAFEYLADACHQPAWCAAVRSARQTRGDGPGPHAAYELTRTVGMVWRPVTAQLELVTYEPQRRLGWTRREGELTAAIQCEVEPLAGTTIVWYAERLPPAGHGFAGVLDVPLRRYQLPRDLWRLKSLLEATAPRDVRQQSPAPPQPGDPRRR